MRSLGGKPYRTMASILAALSTFLNIGCGGGSSSSPPPPTPVTVSISPQSQTVLAGQTAQFTAKVNGTTNQTVVWSIDGAGLGNSTLGTISSGGLYTAPPRVPSPAGVTVRATSNADSLRTATAVAMVISIMEDWPKYRRDLSNTGRSAEAELSSINAAQLKLKWKFLTGGKVSASPAVAAINGTSMVFIGSWDGVFHALDAATGAEIWSFPIDAAPNSGACANGNVACTRIATSPSVENGKVYFGAGNGYMYALNAATGAKVWGSQIGDPTAGVEIWTSPAVYNGQVFTAVASHEDSPCVPGGVLALDASTGAVAWTWAATDPAVPGVGIWASPAVDISVNPALVYIGTGNPGNGCSPPVSTTPNFSYPDGIVALDSTNGNLKSYAPAVLSDTNDCCDFGSSPVLLHTPGPGNTSWVSEANKDGDVFTFPIGSAGILSTSPGALDLGSLGAGEVIASPAVHPGKTGSDANTIFLPAENDAIYVLRQAGDGSVTLQAAVVVNPASSYCSTLGNCPLFSAPASITDLLLFGGGEGNFYAFDEAGNRVFAFGTLGLVPSGPAISHSRVYFGSYDGYVYCLSLNGQ
jgi:outer membrane protein assembly factor BamB